MSLNIVEFFGYDPHDQSDIAKEHRKNCLCPFLKDKCTKQFRDAAKSGACTVAQKTSGPVICCPNRLYGNGYRFLKDISNKAFGGDYPLVSGNEMNTRERECVAVFGKRWGKELRLPKRGGKGAYFVDWILAKVNAGRGLEEFVAIEVQSIDTTGSYRSERDAYINGGEFEGSSNAGLNWENVNKRILPQLIYKGHVLRREPMCTCGMFFVCPPPVYKKVQDRLGGNMLSYTYQPGALTFIWYDISDTFPEGQTRNLELIGEFTTTVDQVATAFTSPTNLPPERVYETAIKEVLGS